MTFRSVMKFHSFSFVQLFFCPLFFLSCKQQPLVKGLDGLHAHTIEHLEHLYALTGDSMLQAIETNDTAKIRMAFLQCRNAYKQLELAIEYFMPGTAKGINGAALTEVETEENKETDPVGLQVVETFLYPSYDTTDRQELIRELRNLHAMVNRAKQVWEVTTPTEKQWVDAAYFEMVRIATLGITGFDTPGCLTGVKESSIALSSVQTVWQALAKTRTTPLQHFDDANKYISAPIDFNAFDRAAFLRGPWQKLFAEIGTYRMKDGLLVTRQALLPSAKSLFGDGVLDIQFFTHDSIHNSQTIVQLGEKLFYENQLSLKENMNCGTCHHPTKFFTDQQALSENIHGNLLARNTPSLINAAFQTSFFWDMRALNLDMQAKAVIDNANEMHGSLDKVSQKLNSFPEWVAAFRKAYQNYGQSAITPEQITGALAAYQRTLINFNSPFDAYMNGDDDAVNKDAVAGFNLFMGKGKCATCHFPPTFAGLVPPFYDKMESEVIGVPKTKANNEKDGDQGRYVIHEVEAYRHAFKTPTVRNASHTFPYMHNGVYTTLEEVVDFYNKGGGSGLGIDYSNQTLPPDPLELTDTEQKQLVTFMKSLSAPYMKKDAMAFVKK
jgi:cytochrome c peroxidase